ncbi:MAG: cation:proton antiporter [Candidatus Aenigmarchaeota archaeon]|nr:cation:proton antiporter [Candidatus Aenigmarchaeota archaeon]
MDTAFLFLLIGIVLVAGFIADYIFRKYGLPDVLILLSAGLLLNFFGIEVVTQQAIPVFSSLALMFIMFEVGTELKFYSLIKEIPRASMWAISVFIFSVLVTIFFSVFIFNFGLNLGILLGAIIGGSSSVVVSPIVSKLNISKDTRYLLTLESTITDALCVVVAIISIEYLILSSGSVINIFGLILSHFSIAIFLGLIAGLFWLNLLPKIESYEYHYILTIGMVFFVYSLTEIFGGTGAISSLVFGIVLGNAIPFGRIFYMKEVKQLTPTTSTFHKLIVFIIRTFFFVVLGSIVAIVNYEIFLYGVLLTFALFFVRFLTSRIYGSKSGGKSEKNLIAVMMPRGLAAAVLAPLPFIQYNIVEAALFPDIVFSVILTSCVISAVSLLILKIE